jgi:hypothetical protein
MNKGTLIAGIIVVGLVAYVGMNPGILENLSVANQGANLGQEGEDPNITKTQSYKGPVDVNSRASDSIETSTTYVHGTAYDVNYYKLVDDTPVFISQSSDAAASTAAIDIELSDKTIWAEVVPILQHYVDAKSITASHTRVGNAVVCDYNNDNTDSYCFPIDVTGYTSDDENPGFTWFVRLYDEGSISLTSPADITALGQGKTSCSIDWEASMDTEGDVEYLTKYLLTLNQTESTDMWFASDSYVKINGVQFTLDEDGLDGVDKASTYTYTNKLATDYLTQWNSINDQGAQRMEYLLNGSNEFDFELKLYTNFDANDEGIQATISLTTEDFDGTNTTVTDAVKCLET